MTCLCGCTCVLSHCHLCKANHFLFLKVKPTHHLGCTLPPLFQWYTARTYQLCHMLSIVSPACNDDLQSAPVQSNSQPPHRNHRSTDLCSKSDRCTPHTKYNLWNMRKPNGLFFKTWNPLMIYFFQSPPPQHIDHHHHHLPPLNAVLVLTKEARPAWSSNEYITRRIFLLIS